MEEENKVVKKNNNPILIIGLALVLIICGVALIVTGNNKSFLAKDKEEPAPVEPEPTPEPQPEPIDDGQRGMVPHALSDEAALQLMVEKKEADFSDATWSIGVVKVIGHDETDEKFLVEYEEYAEDSTISTKQTIISVVNGEQTVELPGWVEGERDLTVYNFSMYEDEENAVVDPTVPDEPTEPGEVVDGQNPSDVVEPTEPGEVVDGQNPSDVVEPTEPVVQEPIITDEPTPESTVVNPEQTVESNVQPGENQ